jgi:excisionase family DNA binding protein
MTNHSDIADLAGKLAQLAERLAAGCIESTSSVVPESSRVLLSVEEAAHRLGIGRTTAYYLIRSGDLDSVRVGRLRRVHVDAINAYAARLVAQAKSETAA